MANFNDRKNVDNNWVGTKKEDWMRGNGGDDTMDGAGGDDWLYGGDGDDTLYGGAGDDYLRGDDGTDNLTGGSGADRFEFTQLSHSNPEHGIDTIHDFNPDEGDGIYLALTYDSSTGTNRPIYFVTEPSGTRDEITLTYDSSANVTVVNFFLNDGDVNPDLTFNLIGQFTTAEGFYGVI